MMMMMMTMMTMVMMTIMVMMVLLKSVGQSRHRTWCASAAASDKTSFACRALAASK